MKNDILMPFGRLEEELGKNFAEDIGEECLQLSDLSDVDAELINLLEEEFIFEKSGLEDKFLDDCIFDDNPAPPAGESKDDYFPDLEGGKTEEAPLLKEEVAPPPPAPTTPKEEGLGAAPAILKKQSSKEALFVAFRSSTDNTRAQSHGKSRDLFLLMPGRNSFISAWSDGDLNALRKEDLLFNIKLIESYLGHCLDYRISTEWWNSSRYNRLTKEELKRLLLRASLEDYLNAIFQKSALGICVQQTECIAYSFKGDDEKIALKTLSETGSENSDRTEGVIVVRTLVERLAPYFINKNLDSLMLALGVEQGFVLKWLYCNPVGIHQPSKKARELYCEFLGLPQHKDADSFAGQAVEHTHFLVRRALFDSVINQLELKFGERVRNWNIRLKTRHLGIEDIVDEFSAVFMPIALNKAKSYEQEKCLKQGAASFMYSDNMIFEACKEIFINQAFSNYTTYDSWHLQQLRGAMAAASFRTIAREVANIL